MKTVEMLSVSKSDQNHTRRASAEQNRFTLWIDGVGAWLLCLADRVTIGGSRLEADSADISLLANLSRRHATLVRSREGYLLEAHCSARVAGRAVQERTYLNNGHEIELAGSVKLRFRLPTVLSATATLDFLSDHRPPRSVDGVVLMDETCLLGPGGENHVRCPNWSDTLALFRKGGEFWCKSRSDVFIDGQLARRGGPLAPGDVVSGNDFRFRIEALG